MYTIPYYPVSHSDGIPQYSVFDVELFGSPDTWGIEKYFVIDEPRYDCNYVPEQEDYDRPNRRERPIHRYDREQRFKWTLRVLMGGSREPIPLDVLTSFHRGDIDWDPRRVWKSVRNALKAAGYPKYYNRIPEILDWHYYSYSIKVPKTVDWQEMYRSFKRLHYNFSKLEWHDRKYFPNLRYIVLRMLMERNVVFEYTIPLLHTKAKIPLLESIWNKLQ